MNAMADHQRRFDGDETWFRLRDWTGGQKASERLASTLLGVEGFDVDPSHPLGGTDGGKDCICRKHGKKLIGAAYFPRGQQTFKDIADKFRGDLAGVKGNCADGIVFLTNQEIRLGERKELADMAQGAIVELYHLERLVTLLNTPANYGLRLEFLKIRITEEEHLAFLADRDQAHYRRFEDINESLLQVISRLEKQTQDLIGYSTGGDSVAYLIPMIGGNARVGLALVNKSEYPVFDIQGFVIDIDENIDPMKGIFSTRNQFVVGSIWPQKIMMDVLRFDLEHRDQVRINIFMRSRNRGVTQQFRIFRVGETIRIANKTESEGKMLEYNVPPDVPGYDPGDPDKVFK